MGKYMDGGLICQGDFVRKIAVENSFGSQTQINDLQSEMLNSQQKFQKKEEGIIIGSGENSSFQPDFELYKA